MLILNLGYIYKQKPNLEPARYNRNQEIVKELVRIVIQYYKTERNVSFYAEKMHLSPQHLSTTIKKITGKTLTDIISSFIIHDAQAKLRIHRNDDSGNCLLPELSGHFFLWKVL